MKRPTSNIAFAAMLCGFVCSISDGQAQAPNDPMETLAKRLAERLVAKKCARVTVLDFTDIQDRPTERGRYLALQLANELVNLAEVSVLDRANLETLMSEHKLTSEGLLRPEDAKKLGQFAGVDAILIGTVSLTDESVEIMVRAICTETSEIVASGKVLLRDAFLNRYLSNRSLRKQPGLRRVAIVVSTTAAPRIDRDLSTNLTTTLRTSGVSMIEDLFTDAFIADGMFDKLSGGSGRTAEQLQLATYTDYVLLCKATVSFSEHSALEKVLSASVKAHATLIDTATGHVLTEFSVSGTGAGFSKADAQNAAYERVASAIGEQLDMNMIFEGRDP